MRSAVRENPERAGTCDEERPIEVKHRSKPPAARVVSMVRRIWWRMSDMPACYRVGLDRKAARVKWFGRGRNLSLFATV